MVICPCGSAHGIGRRLLLAMHTSHGLVDRPWALWRQTVMGQ